MKNTAARQGTSDDLGSSQLWTSMGVLESLRPGSPNILPHLLWLMLVYKVPITIVACFQKKITQFLNWWLDRA